MTGTIKKAQHIATTFRIPENKILLRNMLLLRLPIIFNLENHPKVYHFQFFLLFHNHYLMIFAIVAIIAAIDAEPEAIDTISPVDILRPSGLVGTTISQPGSGFTPRPT